jgi:hypothetical protein
MIQMSFGGPMLDARRTGLPKSHFAGPRWSSAGRGVKQILRLPSVRMLPALRTRWGLGGKRASAARRVLSLD